MEKLERIKLPRYAELPKINLYLDQLIELIIDYLTPILGSSQSKWISSSMIGNYIKQNLLLKPIGKKYSKDHICNVIIISLAKQVFSSVEMEKIVRIMNSIEQNETVDTIGSDYDNFCMEFETIYDAVFSKNIIADSDSNSLSKESFMVRTIIISIINKLYIQKHLDSYLDTINSNNEQKKEPIDENIN